MNTDTYRGFYKNEVRPVTISLRESNNTEIVPTSASTFEVTDCDGSVVLTEDSATISSNTLIAVIPASVTETVGDYYIIWKVVDSNGYIYYHKTHLEVVDILG